MARASKSAPKRKPLADELKFASEAASAKYTPLRMLELAQEYGIPLRLAKMRACMSDPSSAIKVSDELLFMLHAVGGRLSIVSALSPAKFNPAYPSTMANKQKNRIGRYRRGVKTLESLLDLGNRRVVVVSIKMVDNEGNPSEVWLEDDEEAMLRCAAIVKVSLEALLREEKLRANVAMGQSPEATARDRG